MIHPFLVFCLAFNVYLCRAEPVGVAQEADVTPIGCAMNGLIFSMQLDKAGAVFQDSETGLAWKPRGIRCVQGDVWVDAKHEPTAAEMSQRVKDAISK